MTTRPALRSIPKVRAVRPCQNGCSVMRSKKITTAFLVLAVGCAHSNMAPEGPHGAITGYAAFRCTIAGSSEDAREESEKRARAAALRLGIAADSIRVIQPSFAANPVFAASGEPCVRARNRQSCETKVAELEAAGMKTRRVFAIAVRSAEPTLYQGPEGLKNLLGPIDTPEDAWLMWMATEDAPPYECNGKSHSGYRKTPSGFELVRRWTSSLCRPYARTQLVQHVDRHGRVSRVSKYVVAHEAESCIVDESLWRTPSSKPADEVHADEPLLP